MKSILLVLLLLSSSFAADAAQTVEVVSPTLVYDRSDPSFCRNCARYELVEVTDAGRLEALDGIGPSDAFAEYLADGSGAEQALAAVVSGGQLRLSYSPEHKRLVARVTYVASRALTQAELATLSDYTRGQLLDGIGEGFTQTGTHEQRVWVEFDTDDIAVSQRPS